MPEVTTDTILNKFKEWVESKHPISPHLWINSAQKLTVLIGDEHDNLYDLEQKVAQMKVELLEKGETSASAKTRTEATDLHRQMMRQKAKIKQIEEHVRLAKIQARLKDNEMMM